MIGLIKDNFFDFGVYVYNRFNYVIGIFNLEENFINGFVYG